MPLYEFECDACGYTEDVLRKIDERDNHVECVACHGAMARGLTRPTIHTVSTHLMGTNVGDGQGYFDHNLRDRRTGKIPYVTDLGQKRKLLKERGLFEYGNDLPVAKERQDKERMSKRVSFSGAAANGK